jgi:hypothetical protein
MRDGQAGLAEPCECPNKHPEGFEKGGVSETPALFDLRYDEL